MKKCKACGSPRRVVRLRQCSPVFARASRTPPARSGSSSARRLRGASRSALLTLVAAVVPLGIAYVGKAIVDAVVAHSRGRHAPLGAGRARRSSRRRRSSRGRSASSGSSWARASRIDINVLILEKALDLELRHFEDPEFYDQLTRPAARRRRARSRSSRGLPARPELHHARRLRRAARPVQRAARCSASCVGGDPGDARRDALLEPRPSGCATGARRSPGAIALPRVRPRQRRARQGGQALRARAAAARPLQGRWARAFYDEDRRARRAARAWSAFSLSLLGTGAFYAAYAAMALAAARGRAHARQHGRST